MLNPVIKNKSEEGKGQSKDDGGSGRCEILFHYETKTNKAHRSTDSNNCRNRGNCIMCDPITGKGFLSRMVC